MLDTSYLSTVATERDLSDKFWKNQVMFPFPRYTKVLHPKSSSMSPGSSIEATNRWNYRWCFSLQLLLQVVDIRGYYLM